MGKMINEFKEFAMKGNVVDMAIGVVIGGVILAGLYALFNTTVIPTLTTKIQGMFNYAG